MAIFIMVEERVRIEQHLVNDQNEGVSAEN